MTKDDPRCEALAARQKSVYLTLRRLKKSLLDGKQYIPTFTKPQPVVIQESKVLRLRRKT